MKVLLLMCTMCALTSSSSRFSEVTFSFHSWGIGGIKRLLERRERGKEKREGGGGRKEGRGRGEGRVERQKGDGTVFYFLICFHFLCRFLHCLQLLLHLSVSPQ